MHSLKDLLAQHQNKTSRGYIRHEFQDFGYRLALALGDLAHKSLYIKLAKELPRPLLKKALSFALDYPRAQSRARIFMWRLKELRREFKQIEVKKEHN